MDDEPYSVGRGRPPRHTQFRKGKSGNPGGRPPGSGSLANEIRKELLSQTTVRENGRPVKISKVRLFTKALLAKAVNGDAKAAANVIDLLYGFDRPAEVETSTATANEPDVPAHDAALLTTYAASEAGRRS